MRVVTAVRLGAVRGYASQVPLKSLLNLRPPAPPQPPSPPPLPSSSSSSKSNNTTSSTAPQSTLPKPRLDYNRLLSDPAHTTLNALRRNVPLPPDHLAHLSRLRETQLLLLQKLSTIRGKQKEIGSLIRTGLGDVEETKRQAKKLKARVKDYESTLTETENELLDLGLTLPNFSHPSSPIGAEENAVTLETFGPELKEVDPNRDHVRFADQFDLLDTEASAIASGSSWPYLKGTLALLEQALINYALSIAIRNGFTPVVPPDVIKTDIAWRCGFQPRDSATNPSSQTYHIQSTNSDNTSPQLCLAGTSEIPLAGMFADRLLTQESLPRKVVGTGRAFRAEAGARGADTRGLYRVHQFTKVELFVVSAEDESESMMESIRAVQKEIAQGLGLSVRVLDMPTEELGASAQRKYDMEAFMPGRGKWGEITSTSNCTDYQSRRLNITYRPTPTAGATNESNGPMPFAHTLNGTAAAIPRLLVALLENGLQYEMKEGSKDVVYTGLDLPKALERFWVGGNEVGEGSKKGEIRWV
ncbi:serine-tRNA ligase [Kwoniella shandongensis]|uniref:Serine-tRNA ligase n=1 Tax=Kwoniella shandongensis TaxID=1734106 RepID=A0A5M6BQN9_9TREE|nr:serine-tRNA ligase [Kwoniella shandongensis]KAA5524421.1 serine-tRNA ligase [Kwoniella shandongensis]